MKTIGIDSSSTNCGIAIFIDGKFIDSENHKFDGTYSLDKLKLITQTFKNIFDQEKPDMVIFEETVPTRNSRSVTILNQIFGAIAGLAMERGIFVETIHNRHIKKAMGFKTKEQSIRKAERTVGTENITEHEADAINAVIGYMRMYHLV